MSTFNCTTHASMIFIIYVLSNMSLFFLDITKHKTDIIRTYLFLYKVLSKVKIKLLDKRRG